RASNAEHRTLARLGQLAALDGREPIAQAGPDCGIDGVVGQRRHRWSHEQLARGAATAHDDIGRRRVEENAGFGQVRETGAMELEGRSIRRAGGKREGENAAGAPHDGADCAMIARMSRRRAALAAILALVPLAAQAQFYDLDGAYRCLEAP